MSDFGVFEKYRGKTVSINSGNSEFYVPTLDEEEHMILDARENLCFEKEGFEIVALEGCIEEGEMVQLDGLLAVNRETGSLIHCEEGTNSELKATLSNLTIEVHQNS